MAKNIEVTLTLDSKQFKKGISSAKNSMKTFSSQGSVTKGTVMGLASKLLPLAAGFLAIKSAVDTVGKSLSVSAQFEDVGIVLESIVGSAAGGAAALNMITEAATKLPFAFEDLAGAAPALATVSGTIGELEDNMMLAADIAASFGIPFEVAASQLQRSFSAGAGAADVFREKGILSAAGFEAGVTMSIEETQKKLREFGGTIEGSSQKLNKTFNGAVSQAGDAMTLFQKAIGDAFRPEATAFLTTLTEKFRENKKEIMAVAKSIGENVIKAFIGFLRAGATVIDMMTSFGQVAKRIAQGFRKNFGEQIRVVANFLVKAFGLIVEGLSLVGKGIGKVIEVTTGVDSVTQFFDNMLEGANKLRTEGLGAIEEVGEGLSTFIPVTTARDAIEELVTDFTTGGQEIRDDLQKTSDEAANLGNNLKINLTNGIVDAGAAMAAATQDASDLATSLVTLLGVDLRGGKIDFSKSGDDMRKVIADGQTLEIALGSIQSAFNGTVPSVNEYNQAIKFLTDNFKELGLSAPELATIIANLNEQFMKQEGIRNFLATLGQAQKALSDDLATAFLEGESAGKAFQSFFKKMITQIISDIIRLKIVQPLLSGIFGAMGMPVSFTPGGTAVPGKASGGPVMPGGTYLVGEKGPELLQMGSQGGNIVPNGQFGGSQVTYNINAVDAPSFQQLVAQDPQFIYAVTQAGARSIPGSR